MCGFHLNTEYSYDCWYLKIFKPIINEKNTSNESLRQWFFKNKTSMIWHGLIKSELHSWNISYIRYRYVFEDIFARFIKNSWKKKQFIGFHYKVHEHVLDCPIQHVN